MQQQHQLLASQLHMQRAAVDQQQQHGQRLAAEQQAVAQMAAAAAAAASAAAAAAKSPRAADPLAHGSPGSVASSADAHFHDQAQPHDQQHHQPPSSTLPAHAVLQQLQQLGAGVRQLQERQGLMQGALRAHQGLLDELQVAVAEQNVTVSEQGQVVAEHHEALAEHRQLLTQHHGAVERLLGVVSEQQAAVSEQRRALDGALGVMSQVVEGARRDEGLRAELSAAVAAVREEAEQHACAARASVDELAKGMEHLAACMLAAVVAAPPAPVSQPLDAGAGTGAVDREGQGDEGQGEAAASGSGLGEVRQQVRALQREMRRMRAAVAAPGGVGMGSARGAGGLAAGGSSSSRRRASASSALNSARASATSLGAVSSGSGSGRQQQQEGQGQGGGARGVGGSGPLSGVVRRRQRRQERALVGEQQGLGREQGLEVEVWGVAEAGEGMVGAGEGDGGALLRRLQQLSREVEVLRSGEALALEVRQHGCMCRNLPRCQCLASPLYVSVVAGLADSRQPIAGPYPLPPR